jgi:hypothetical protein
MKSPDLMTDAILRQKAEELLQKMPEASASHFSETEAMTLIHELEVHQIELEMVNEELQQLKNKAEAAADKYTELYDFAPSGYFTLSGGSDAEKGALTFERQTVCPVCF